MRAVLLFTFILSMLLMSCVPQQSVSERKLVGSDATSDSSDEDEGSNSAIPLSEYYWYSGGEQINGTITLSQSTNDTIFIRGAGIESWIDLHSDQNFCLIGIFDAMDAKKQARFKAIARSWRNPITGDTEKLLQINLADQAGNQAQCAGSLSLALANAQTTSIQNYSATTTESAFALKDICPTCKIPISTIHLGLLFLPVGQSLENTPLPTVQSEYFQTLEQLTLSLAAATAEAPPSAGSCDANVCQALGKDCCIDGQCVNNGALRPNASSRPEYIQAMIDYNQNPATYTTWPQIFYVCEGSVDPSPGDDDPPAPPTVDELLKLRTMQYNCLEGGKTGNYTSCEPEQNVTSYHNIQIDVWKTCGCEANYDSTDSNDPTNPINACPDFGLKVTEENADGTPAKIECLIPTNDEPTGPFQDLNLQLSGKTTPHRFFTTDGTPVDDLSKVDATTQQESATEDPDGKFNMNRILGDMLVDLTKAEPAKVVNVEYDQSYIIRVKSGSYYTPCPSCSQDSWYEGFTAFPQPIPVRGNLFGNGLQGSPTNTNRAASSITSMSKGNYEDTIWGRACWLPPTMLPYSHRPDSDVQKQRRMRLETQAALYMNGYRKDWYGFNQGAIIGSFDGVKWFAIGSGRQVVATSNKLFLAINAPFADLASSSAISLEITEYLGPNSIAITDFDPELTINDPRQNLAGSCQAYHLCSVDADCITQLGWEYMCAPVAYHKTYWPEFDINANEKRNSEIESEGYMQMLQTGVAPSKYNKRCVYRGAGAPCIKDANRLENMAKNDDLNLRHLICAPNFYCASLDSSFNNDINREPELIGNILYGQEADVLGRPPHYLGGDGTLLENIKNNLLHNLKLYDSTLTTDDIGICRPGRSISNQPYKAHEKADFKKRTDYISQIGGCDNKKTGYLRVVSCPYIIENASDDTAELPESEQPGNYKFIKDSTYSTVDSATAPSDAKSLMQQNSCGQESLNANGESPFQLIEAPTLQNLTQLISPKLPINACFRRAGSVCHSNLDCSPNIMHANEAISYDESYFGGTLAEKQYWEESLICGQAQPIPSLNNIAASTYSVTKNRCCREIGKEFTMYTETDSSKVIADIDTSNIINRATGTGLKVDRLTIDGNSQQGRYSRYISSQPTQGVFDRTSIHSETPAVYTDPTELSESHTPYSYQWKTIHDTGRRMCCGSSFIRKFSDGSHDWTKRDRLHLNGESFRCLNYSNMLYDLDHEFKVDNNDDDQLDTLTNMKALMWSSDNITFERERGMMCLSPSNEGCVQIPFEMPTDSFAIKAPRLVTGYDGIMSTVPVDLSYKVVTKDAPYSPLGYDRDYPDAIAGRDYDLPTNHIPGVLQKIVYFHLPIYINASTENRQNIKGVYIHYFCDGQKASEAAALDTDVTNPYVFWMEYDDDVKCDQLLKEKDDDDEFDNLDEGKYCIATGGVFFAKGDDSLNLCPDTNGNAYSAPWAYAGIVIKFRPINTPGHIYRDNRQHDEISGLTGKDYNGFDSMYYLSKLGRLELLGIPQIIHEPITCNSNHSELLAGMYSTTLENNLRTNGGGERVTYNRTDGIFYYGNSKVASSLGKIYADTSSDTNYYSGTEDDSNYYQFALLQNMLTDNHPAIFASSDFLCCAKLGSLVDDYHKCCSGYGIREGDNVSYTCLLPTGTDLNVYFNRFVSSEGYYLDLPESLQQYGFKNSDFVPETGEPKLQNKVYDKLYALGRAYCTSGKVRSGSAFGEYNAQPYAGYVINQGPEKRNPRYYSIVDSSYDWDSEHQMGMNYFNFGYRWNHHLYCDQ